MNSLSREIIMAAVIKVTELLCVKSFLLTRMLLSCVWLLALSPAWLLLSGQGKCWVTRLEPQGFNLGVTGSLKAYRSAWMLECLAGCLHICWMSACVWNYVCLWIFVCVFCIPMCVSEAQSRWIDRFGCYCSGQEVLTHFFFLLGCWIGKLFPPLLWPE